MNQPRPPHERPTAQELATGGGPWSCRHCACKDTRVVNTWVQEGGAIRRKRVCRNCGQDFTLTTEVPCPKGLKVVVEDEEQAVA